MAGRGLLISSPNSARGSTTAMRICLTEQLSEVILVVPDILLKYLY